MFERPYLIPYIGRGGNVARNQCVGPYAWLYLCCLWSSARQIFWTRWFATAQVVLSLFFSDRWSNATSLGSRWHSCLDIMKFHQRRTNDAIEAMFTRCSQRGALGLATFSIYTATPLNPYSRLSGACLFSRPRKKNPTLSKIRGDITRPETNQQRTPWLMRQGGVPAPLFHYESVFVYTIYTPNYWKYTHTNRRVMRLPLTLP